ncbi:hypothetical protein BpHYR1_012867 [Brachionus plicatilis]|uniref:Uncharacterized protein n=1 Tax=Brachionus plicatilis TaxID=10195 RepID=A0A3M7RZA4_BRAPC|nr:hypothetical protein BpHYR1_012867 [Brachionus plicatilis]
MTGISGIAVVVGLGINCCAYAQGVNEKNGFGFKQFDVMVQIEELESFEHIIQVSVFRNF